MKKTILTACITFLLAHSAAESRDLTPHERVVIEQTANREAAEDKKAMHDAKYEYYYGKKEKPIKKTGGDGSYFTFFVIMAALFLGLFWCGYFTPEED